MEDVSDTPPDSTPSIAPGCRAIISGLHSKPELNGKEAAILSWVAAKERWAVLVVGNSMGITLKPGNLNRSPCSMQHLDDEALTQVLVRTKDPGTVSKVCRRFNAVVTAPTFKADRIRLDFANVSVHLQPKEDDDYDDDDYEPPVDLGWAHDLGGYAGGYGCTRNFGAFVTVDGDRAGRIDATLINRAMCARHSVFLSACDAESQELIDIGRVLFNEKGHPRYRPLKNDPRMLDSEAGKRGLHSGAFLYISNFELEARFRPDGCTGVAARAVWNFLALPGLIDRWTVAAYIADGRAGLDSAFGRFEEPTAEERAARTAQWLQNVEADCRPFVRNYFAEITAPSGGYNNVNEGWLWLTKGMWLQKARSHEQTMRVPLRAQVSAQPKPPPKAEPTGLDAELREAVRADSVALTEIDRLISAGASLDAAGALHQAAYNRQAALARALVQRGADVNGRDASEQTPLMVAAQAVDNGVTIHNPSSDTSCVDALIALGANKALTNSDGLTALGLYRSKCRSMDDFRSALTSEARRGTNPAIEATLLPPDGPTPADEEEK